MSSNDVIDLPWEEIFRTELAQLRASHLHRVRRVLRTIDSTHVEHDGRRLINFASNNYLGLTHHPRVISAIERTVRETGTGAAAAGLITGYTDVHASAEAALAEWKGTEAAVLLPSGYQANHAAVQAIAAVGERARGVRFLMDKLVHASIIDAVRATGQPFRVFPHNSLAKLRRLLAENEAGGLQVVITESIFSMDGDAADLPGLAALKREHPFMLVLDEAHAAGVYGLCGAGLASELGVQASVDVSIATLSKAIGCAGGVVCGSRRFCDALVNFGRAYMFSTSIPPFVAAAAEAALAVMRDEPGRQRRVRALSHAVRSAFRDSGVELPSGDAPIIPVIRGSADAALDAARRLLEAGLLVLAIRPPTVPRGSSRIRVTVSSEHTDAEVEQLVSGIRGLDVPGAPA